MIDIGHFSLVLAWLLSLYGLVAGIWGAKKKNSSLVASAGHSVHLVAFLSMVSLVYLAFLFLSHDYRYLYVWRTSNNDMHPMYLVSAIWGGMDGSMLLWAAIMAGFASLVVFLRSGVQRELMAWVIPVLSGATNFFLFVVAFLTNPFRVIAGTNIPLDGNGLNPLLQNPSMIIHPPCLYLGFTGFVVPFAFSVAALLSGNLSTHWIAVTRRWTLVAWMFLTAGIILGGNWAYIELGWGGFWAWDPVENSSFLPWLTGTAFLHSVMVQERRGMLKVWNVSLSVATYLLTVFGTFLTRSGVVQSVHAFAETDIGWVFLLYIGIMTAITVALIAYRWQELRPESRLESYFSREAAFLFNNLALLGICFATFWGVMFPVFSEAMFDTKSVVGPPFFNKVNVPLFLILLFLMGVGPLIAWRRSSLRALFKVFARPMIYGSVVTALFLVIDFARPLTAMSFGLSIFVLATIFAEIHRGLKARKHFADESVAAGLVGLVRRKPRRYGGFLVHLGVVVMAISITASMVYKIEKDFVLKKGERFSVGRYELVLKELVEKKLPNYLSLRAVVQVFDKEGKQLGELLPERRVYRAGQANEEITTEVDIRMTPLEDLYLALGGLEVKPGTKSEDRTLNKLSAVFKVFVNPLQMWLWVGSVIMLFGTALVIGPGLRAPATEQSVAANSVTAVSS